jgi:signal peptide peptidase SppA
MPEVKIIQPAVAHLNQYVGPWAMDQRAFDLLLGQVRGLELKAHTEAMRARAAAGEQFAFDPPYHVEPNGIAVLEVVGILTKYGTSLSDGPSTLAVRQTLRRAVADVTVKGIVLLIDSPGGNVRGIDDLARDVAAAARAKPLTAYIEDLGASGAYWIASQAGRIVANPAGTVGSIGVYAVVEDLSGMAEQLGVKVHVIRAGDFKGAGEPGSEVTDQQLTNWQREVDEVNGLFLQAVRAGRGLTGERLIAVADGRVHIAGEALKLGLIDAIKSFDNVLASAAAVPLRPSQERDLEMRTEAQVIDGGQGRNPPGRARRPNPYGPSKQTLAAREVEARREQHPFIRQSKELAAAEGVDLHVAMARIASTKPEIYASYRRTFSHAFQEDCAGRTE